MPARQLAPLTCRCDFSSCPKADWQWVLLWGWWRWCLVLMRLPTRNSHRQWQSSNSSNIFWTCACSRHNAFELRCWRRLLRVPGKARRSNQSILKETNPEYSLEGLMLKLKLQYFGHLIWRADSLVDPAAGKDWEQEEKGATEDEMVVWHHQPLSGH